jgi:hypothetical protein
MSKRLRSNSSPEAQKRRRLGDQGEAQQHVVIPAPGGVVNPVEPRALRSNFLVRL